MLDVSRPDEKYVRDKRVGILTGCVFSEPVEGIPGLINLSFDSSVTDAHHPGLWFDRGISGTDPIATKVSYKGRRYGLGGSFNWNPRTQALTAWILVEAQGLRRHPEHQRQLGAMIAVASGEIILGDLGANPNEATLSFNVSTEPHERRPRTPEMPLLQHAARLNFAPGVAQA